MIVKPTVNELLEYAENRYELVIATSKRARQIAKGDEPLIEERYRSTVTVAANEIVEGKVEICGKERKITEVIDEINENIVEEEQ